MRAEVRASLPDHDALDRPPASQARLAGAPVDRQPLSVVPWLAIGPDVVAEARAPVADALAQDPPDGPMQAPHLLGLSVLAARSGLRRASQSASSA